MREAVASALAELSRRDERASDMARLALDTLAPEQDLQRLNQHIVQRFCWYELPVRFQNSPDDQLFAVRSLGHLFQLLQLYRYANVCSFPRDTLDRVFSSCTRRTTPPGWPCSSDSCGSPGSNPPTCRS